MTYRKLTCLKGIGRSAWIRNVVRVWVCVRVRYRNSSICQKRPTYMTKETYTCDKRDLHIWLQETYGLTWHANVVKECACVCYRHDFIYDKRDLHIWSKRSTCVASRDRCTHLTCTHAHTHAHTQAHTHSRLYDTKDVHFTFAYTHTHTHTHTLRLFLSHV